VQDAPSASYISARDLAVLDLSQLVKRPEEAATAYLTPVLERAEARVNRLAPITPVDRFRAFELLGYRPHGLFVPDDEAAQEELRHRVRTIGQLADPDARIGAYLALQAETAAWEQAGVPGHWTGQQAIARSSARHRLVEYGRRAGKTFHASREGAGIAMLRPYSVIWVAAQTNTLVARCYDMIMEIFAAQRVHLLTRRDTKDEKLAVLANGSRIEGVSLERYKQEAGAAVDLAIVDEAALIDEEQFTRAILPPLTDKDGGALLVSSPEGEGSYIHRRAGAALKEHDPDWDVFIDASYDVNFYMFPQGRQTAAIRQAEREMSPEDFLEQFGGIAAGAKNRIYPQYRDDVHVEPCPFDPDEPVELAIDPSGGAVAYAVEALQVIDGLVRVFDEYYVEGALAEDAIAWAEGRPWRANVTLAVMDSASLSEVRRWQQNGFPAFGVKDKPQPYERYPFYRRLLRDPRRFHPFYQELRDAVMDAEGYGDDEEFEQLPERDQGRIVLEIEESLSKLKITPAHLERLRECRRMVFDPRCAGVIAEHPTYAYRKPRLANTDLTEQPRKYHDHGLDALGYWVWHHRFDFDDIPLPLPTNVLQAVGGNAGEEVETDDEGRPLHGPRPLSFLEQMRAIHSPTPDFSYLLEG
jgi:hypothetical protein